MRLHGEVVDFTGLFTGRHILFQRTFVPDFDGYQLLRFGNHEPVGARGGEPIFS